MSKPDLTEFINEDEDDLEAFLYNMGNFLNKLFLDNFDLFRIEFVDREKIKSMNLINTFPNELKDKMIEYLVKKHNRSRSDAVIYTIGFMTSVYGLCMNLYYLKTFTPTPDFTECLHLIVAKFK